MKTKIEQFRRHLVLFINGNGSACELGVASLGFHTMEYDRHHGILFEWIDRDGATDAAFWVGSISLNVQRCLSELSSELPFSIISAVTPKQLN